MKKKLVTLSGLVFGFTPLLALAQVATGGAPTSCGAYGAGGTATITDFQGILCKIANLLSAVIPILILLGVVFFVWGVVQYVIGGDEEAKKKGKDKIIYGIIGLAVIISVWGLAVILRNTFVGTNANQQNVNYPTVAY